MEVPKGKHMSSNQSLYTIQKLYNINEDYDERDFIENDGMDEEQAMKSPELKREEAKQVSIN